MAVEERVVVFNISKIIEAIILMDEIARPPLADILEDLEDNISDEFFPDNCGFTQLPQAIRFFRIVCKLTQ